MGKAMVMIVSPVTAANNGLITGRFRIALDTREVGDGPRSLANFIEQLQAVLPQRLVVGVDRDLVEEGVDRRSSFAIARHGGGEIFLGDGGGGVLLGGGDGGGERLLFGLLEQRGIGLAG